MSALERRRARPGASAWTLGAAALAVLLALLTAAPAARAAAGQGGYAQIYRPQVHFTPARHWMNDPNGLVYFDGWYHLFFQYNPYGSRWGNMSWGHAVSRDLLHWRQLPVAIPQGRRHMIFSGSAVVDWHDSSGFGVAGRPPLVAIYTAAPRGSRGPQTQNLAYSTDGGWHWRKYAGNPVLNIGLRNFRDPKVFWYAPAHDWIMVVSRAAERRVSFYASRDLKTWRHTGDFGPAGDTRGVWECPDLFELPVENRPGEMRWVLKVDVQQHRPGTGEGGQVIIGRFNGRTFSAISPHAQPVDLGEDYYASASWSNLPPGGPGVVTLGWMDNWLYAQNAPTAPWRGTMAFPRALSLRRQGATYRLIQRPIAALATLRGASRQLGPFAAPVARTVLTVPARGAAHEIQARIDVGRQGRFVLTIGSSDGRQVRLGYDAQAGQFTLRRLGHYRFSPVFDADNAAPLAPHRGAIALNLIIDRSSVEAFVNHGALTAAESFYARGGAYTVTVRTTGARIERMRIWRLRSIWRGGAP